MDIPDNVIAKKLRRVYFIFGSSCGGKTTAALELCRKYGFFHYNTDEMRSVHFADASPEYQPALCRDVPDVSGLDPMGAEQWEEEIVREMTPMIIADLIELAGKYPAVICEGDIDVGFFIRQISLNNIICLSACRAFAKREFFDRPDHAHMLESIRARGDLTEAEKEERISNMYNIAGVSGEINPEDFEVRSPPEVMSFGIKQYIRNENSTVEQMIETIESHFRLK